MSFPLKLTNVEQIDSKRCFGIQLADLLIGGMIEHAMSEFGVKEKNDYNQNIIELYDNKNLLTLLPNVNFEESIKERSNSDSFEFIEFLSSKIK